jgi:initiation factor 1A
MVKNTGGKRTKGLARKNETGFSVNRLRVPECEQERYAVVRKIFGGSRCDVFCDDLVARQAIIRGKFSGKNKRRNIIAPGTIILIGIRDWATLSESKIQECDVLEVYSPLEFDQLKQRPSFPYAFLNINNNNTDNKQPFDDFVFSSINNDNDNIDNNDIQPTTILQDTEIDFNDI